MEMEYLESGCSGHSKRARIVPGRKDGESPCKWLPAVPPAMAAVWTQGMALNME